MIKISGHKSTEAVFLRKDTFNLKFKDKDYLFLYFNKSKIDQIQKKISKYKHKDKQIIAMINNFKTNNLEKLKKKINYNKINIKLILPIFQNNQKKILKVFIFSNGNIYKTKFHIFNPNKKTFLQRVWNIRGSFPYETDSTPYSPEQIKEYTMTPSIKVYDDVINNLILSLFRIKNNFFTIYKIKLLNIYFFFKFFPQQKFLNQIFYSPIRLMMRMKRILKRYYDIFMMTLAVFLFPKYLFKFSTRNVFPENENKFIFDKRKLQNSILVDKKNFQNIKLIKEANLILRGSSLKNFKIKNKSLPTFIVSCLSPNELENLSLIISKNLILVTIKDNVPSISTHKILKNPFWSSQINDFSLLAS